MEYRITKRDDVTVKINGVFIGGLVESGYDVNYPYSADTGVDAASPEYIITVSYRPVIGTERATVHNLDNASIQIVDPWRTVSFSGCKTWKFSSVTDKDGMIETVKFIGYGLSIT